MEEDKKKAGEKIGATQPAEIKKGLQNSTRGPKKSRTARESYVF